MYFVVFSLKNLSLPKAMTILERMDKERGACGGFFALPDMPRRPKTDYGIVFGDSTDFNNFKRHLHERGVSFTEPDDLPAEIKNSFQYQIFLNIIASR